MNDKKNETNTQKREYARPHVRAIELLAKEVLGTVCRTSLGANPVNTTVALCVGAGCLAS